MPNDPFVDVAALSSLGSIRYLDARDQAMFDAGHAPGAVRVPVDEWDKAAKAADVGFANTAYWDHALGSLGVDPSALAVTYDGGQMSNAARVWFIFQYFRHQGSYREWRLARTFRSCRGAGGHRTLEGRFPGGSRLRVRRLGRSRGPQASA
jgi:3-mercaptopyruvate sulfurtransferase SseA